MLNHWDSVCLFKALRTNWNIFPENTLHLKAVSSNSSHARRIQPSGAAYLPGKYAAPEGCILLAWDELDCVGCAGLRPLSDDVCEMKRLYVKPLYRGTGLGRLLAENIVQLGIDKKYTRMQLDTLNSMQSAVGLYKSLGFVETDQYYNNPHPEVVFFELTLD